MLCQYDYQRLISIRATFKLLAGLFKDTFSYQIIALKKYISIYIAKKNYLLNLVIFLHKIISSKHNRSEINVCEYIIRMIILGVHI